MVSLEMMKYPNARILQFAKSPQRGRVKTRLTPVLDDDQSLAVHQCLVDHCFQTLSRSRLAPLDLWLDKPAVEHKTFWSSIGATRFNLQVAGDLGERMHQACCQTLKPQGDADALVLVGSDCPLLSADVIDSALAALYGGADVVFGPATDGGYYLVGMKTPHQALFSDVPWGTEKVYKVTLNRLSSLALKLAEMPSLSDLDRPEDLPLMDKIPLSTRRQYKIIFNLLSIKDI